MLLLPLGHETATVHPEHDEVESREISDVEAGDEIPKSSLRDIDVTQVRVCITIQSPKRMYDLRSHFVGMNYRFLRSSML